MARPSNKQKILDSGLRTVHQHGYRAAGIREIVKAAGVPQGSFTNHFTSKEAFGLEILNLYYVQSKQVIDQTLLNEALSPIKRLEEYLEENRKRILEQDLRNGCLFGNFSAEVTDQSEMIRERLVSIFREIRNAFEICLSAASESQEIEPLRDVQRVAATLLSSLQGAILLSKATRSVAPFDDFRDVFLATFLRKRQ